MANNCRLPVAPFVQPLSLVKEFIFEEEQNHEKKNLLIKHLAAENKHDKPGLDCYIIDMNSMNQILQEAIHLPEDQRLTLAHRLLMASEPHISEDVKNAWDAEIRTRIERYDRGESHSRTASEVFKDLDYRLKA